MPTDRSPDRALADMTRQMEFMERLCDEKFAARDRALNIALATMDRRLDAINEVRNALSDQANRFLSRDEYLAAHASLVRDVDATRIDLSKYAVRVDEYDKTSSVERAQLDKRLDAMTEFRAQLKDQAATLISRSEVAALIEGLVTDVRRLEIAAGQKAGRDDSAAAFDRMDVRLKLVESKLATWDGRLWALGTIFLMINIFVSWWLSGIHVPRP